MQGLLRRQSVTLGQPQWLIDPWQNAHKSSEQSVYDYGLVLAGIFEKVDMLYKSNLDEQQCLNVLSECNDVQEGIQRIMQQDIAFVSVCDNNPRPMTAISAALYPRLMLIQTAPRCC